LTRVSKPVARVLAVDSPTSLDARKAPRRVSGVELKRGGPVNGHPPVSGFETICW
jgi:hypothetical protein